MKNLSLYRRRLIPDECILLKDDILLEANDDHILTKWNTLKPKEFLHHGDSCYYLNKGVKVSRFYTEDNFLICWYCDIVSYEWKEEKTALLTTDLLLDVLVYPDGSIKLLDMDELAQAHAQKLISDELLQTSLMTANRLLNEIYEGKFHDLYTPVFHKY
ncbi:MAG: DUF402 domain-containing protein [Lachnospiraceae bacterium]|jgi:protein associated with RNAse G/E|nr:DUF402 domain-containing protein [Lachnospiraceae bacterium]